MTKDDSTESRGSGPRWRRWLRGAHAPFRDVVASAEPGIRWIVFAFALFELLGLFWDQPGFYGWENDGAAPRDFLGGVAENLTPGKAHRYPLFHYLLIGLVASPVLLIDVIYAAVSEASIVDTVVGVPSMTAIALVTKLLHVGMTCLGLTAAARVWRTLFGSVAAHWALAFTAANLTVAYYGRVTNVDTAYLMWIVLAVDRLVLIAREGDWHHYGWFAFFTAASIAAKDQAYATYALVGPIYLVLLPLLFPTAFAAGRRHFARLGAAAGLGAGLYATLSGAVINPTGFVARIKMLTGTNSQDWRQYPLGFEGVMANLQDLFRFQTDFFWPLPVLIVAWAGVLVALSGYRPARTSWPKDGFLRWGWGLLPLVAGISTMVAFTLVVARAEHRFMLVFAYWFSGYAGVAVAALANVLARVGAARSASVAGAVLVGVGFAPNVELVVTQWLDARRDVERFLQTVPDGTTVETHGLGVYLPRFDLGDDAPYRTTRVSAVGWGPQPPIVGLSEIADDFMNYPARRPDLIVVPEGFLDRFRERSDSSGLGRAMLKYRRAPGAMPFFGALRQDRLHGYRLLPVGALRAPSWYSSLGGRLLEVHGSTGRRVWVFARDDWLAEHGELVAPWRGSSDG